MVEDGAFSNKIDNVIILKKILNLEGHPNRIKGSKVTAILLNWWTLPISGASAVKGLRQDQLLNDEGVCRTAPATPGLLITKEN